MSPEEIAKLASFLAEEIKRERQGGEIHAVLAAELAARYVMFERTEPQRHYCDECGFNATGNHAHPANLHEI